MQKTAICLGVLGQDGSYMSDLLLEHGYKVIGVHRQTGMPNFTNINHLLDNENFILEHGDINDFGSISRILQKYPSSEFYNFAAMSSVGASWDEPIATCQTNFVGVCNCLEAIRLHSPKTKFFHASSTETIGSTDTEKQNELAPTNPRSPYAAAKCGAESLIKVYRDSYGLFACFARAANHDSPRRGRQFVTRKITLAIGDMFKTVDDQIDKIIEKASTVPVLNNWKCLSTTVSFDIALQNGFIKPINLGNIDVRRDFSHAKDIVKGIYLMMQQDRPDDYVLASGQSNSIRDFLSIAFNVIGLSEYEKFIKINKSLYRPADIACLCGDPTKAYEKLGWKTEISFKDMVTEMVKHDMGL